MPEYKILPHKQLSLEKKQKTKTKKQIHKYKIISQSRTSSILQIQTYLLSQPLLHSAPLSYAARPTTNICSEARVREERGRGGGGPELGVGLHWLLAGSGGAARLRMRLTRASRTPLRRLRSAGVMLRVSAFRLLGNAGGEQGLALGGL